MDVLFIRREDGQLERQVYQKKTHTNRYMQYNSHHPVEIKSGIIQGLVYRAMNVCSDRSGRNKEIKRIKDVMQSNGYPRKFTEKAIRRQMKRRTIPKEKEIDDKKLQTARIPSSTVSARKFGVWHEAGVRCAFFMRHARTRLPKQRRSTSRLCHKLRILN